MPTIDDLLKNYNSELIERFKGYVTEDFSEFIDELTKTWDELLEGEAVGIIGLAGDPEAEAKAELRKRYKGFFDEMRKDTAEYDGWRQAFAHKFENIGKFLEALNPIIEGHKELAKNIKKTLTKKEERYPRFVKAYEKMVTEMAYLCFPLEPLYKRYEVTITVGMKEKDGGYKDCAPEEFSNALMDPKKTIFGKSAPATSVLSKYRFQDKHVSRQHGRFGYDKDGYLVFGQLGKNASTIVDAEGIERKVEQGKKEMLVRAHRDGDTEKCEVYFGGKDGKLYRMRLLLEPKIQLGQVKDDAPKQPAT